ncbi:hypothetical protein V1478_007339 [Vespula squamosa]|uniref:Uncharacterized protein n=1 Tax=Vespula squamosa TaxID=30214 RepID=A0ABD2B2W9_VESSQ
MELKFSQRMINKTTMGNDDGTLQRDDDYDALLVLTIGYVKAVHHLSLEACVTLATAMDKKRTTSASLNLSRHALSCDV